MLGERNQLLSFLRCLRIAGKTNRGRPTLVVNSRTLRATAFFPERLYFVGSVLLEFGLRSIAETGCEHVTRRCMGNHKSA